MRRLVAVAVLVLAGSTAGCGGSGVSTPSALTDVHASAPEAAAIATTLPTPTPVPTEEPTPEPVRRRATPTPEPTAEPEPEPMDAPPTAPAPPTPSLTCDNPEYHLPPFRLVVDTIESSTSVAIGMSHAISLVDGSDLPVGQWTEPPMGTTLIRYPADRRVDILWTTQTIVAGGKLVCTFHASTSILVPGLGPGYTAN